MASDRSLSPSPGAKRIDDVVLNHQLTPSCTNSKLVELAASGIVLFLNHSLHTPSGSQVITVSTFLVSLESICSRLGAGLVPEGDPSPEVMLVSTEFSMHPNVVW